MKNLFAMSAVKPFGALVILILNLLVISATCNVVPDQIKHPLMCQYKQIFYSCFYCDKSDGQLVVDKCAPFRSVNTTSPAFFILYDINTVEGFNLRRDIYIRLVNFLHLLRRKKHYENAYLVLPPFYRLYHWNLNVDVRSKTDGWDPDDVVFWNHFFDLDSLKRYAPVLDLWEYFDVMKECFGSGNQIVVDNVFRLQNFEDMFQGGKFEEKFEVKKDCDEHAWHVRGQFIYLYSNFTLHQTNCVDFQGSGMILHGLLQKYPNRSNSNVHSVALLNTETVLHDHWGGHSYWTARRSMRFNLNLVRAANHFRRVMFNSSDEFEGTQRPLDWRNETEHRNARGGNYLCAHLRRADFVRGREETTPTLRSAATQILYKLNALRMKKVFISSDCTGPEFNNFKSFLSRYPVKRFLPSPEERELFKAGGIAIIDQIICSHARYFMGTYDSTFTYRIYEEREILGFPSEATFNTLCKEVHEPDTCQKNSNWTIVY